MRPANEAEIVALAKAGDRTAFDVLAARQYGRLSTYLRCHFPKLNNPEDAIQDAMEAAWKGIRNFRGDSSFSTWMTRITIRAAIALLKQPSANDEFTAAPPVEEAPEIDEISSNPSICSTWRNGQAFPGEDIAGPVRQLEAAQMAKGMDEAIRDLSPGLRRVIKLVVKAGGKLPHSEIASRLGISTAASKVRLFEARSAIRASLERRGLLAEAA